MNILITGAHGQVGRELTHQGTRSDLRLWPTDVEELDITSKSQVQGFVARQKIALVVNAAAYTAVDRAESEPTKAWRINRDGPAILAQVCADADLPLVHLSTDYVYDGSRTSPYNEDAPLAPTGVYGASKAAGDLEVQRRLGPHIILRTAWLYSIHGRNFVKTILRLARERETLQVVDDQVGCPTSAGDLAHAILQVIDRIATGRPLAWGIYHYCGAGHTTWYDFASAILAQASRYENFALKALIPVTSSEYPTAAKRPSYSVLDCSKIGKVFGITPPPWRTSLAHTISLLYQSQPAS